MPIVQRLFVLILIAVLPLLGMEVYNEMRLREALLRDITGASERLLFAVLAEHARLIEGARLALGTIRILEQPDRPQFCARTLAALAGQLPSFKTLYVHDEEGVITCASDHRWVGHRFQDNSSESLVANGQFPYWLALAHSPLDQHGDRLMLVEAGGRDGQRIGIAIDGSWLDAFVAKTHPRETAQIVLWDGDGRVIHGTQAPAALSGSPVPREWAALAQPGRVTVARMPNFEGVPSAQAVAPLSSDMPRISLAASIAEAETLAPIDAAVTRSLLLWLVALVTTFAAVWIGGEEWIRGPIGQMVATTRRWRDGERAARAALTTSTTELKRLGDALDQMADALEHQQREREAAAGKLSNILESTTDAVAELNRDWRCVFLNSRAQEVLEHGGTIIGTTIWEAFPAIVGSADERHLRRAMEEREVVEYETYYLPCEKWFHVRAFPSPEGLALFFRNVTEAKALEETARRTQGLLSQMLEALPVGVWIVDDTGRIVRANPAGRRIWEGARYVELEGYGQYKGWHVESGKPIGAEEWAATRAITKGKATIGEMIEIECFDGSRKTILNSALPLKDSADNIVGAIIVNEDVTALRTAKETAERANAAKSKFLASASHDLRQPVQSLYFMIDVLAATAPGKQAPKLVGNMRNTAEALRSILDGLLDISKLDVGAVQPSITDIPVASALAQIEEEYRARFQAKGITLKTVKTSAWARTDFQLFGRMLRNLVENALKYTPKGKIVIGCRKRRDKLLVTVADSGIGIPPERLNDIWEEFVQVGNPERDRRLGLGLGLAIVRRLGELLDHQVKVRSTVGNGSVFTIELPLAAKPASAADTLPTSGPTSGAGTLVVIDDEPMILEGLRTVLELAGYRVLAGEDLAAALGALQDWGGIPDALVVDYRLRHGKTGLEAANEIRTILGRSLPTIIITGDTTPELAEAARGGCCRIMNKPVSADELCVALRELIFATDATRTE